MILCIPKNISDKLRDIFRKENLDIEKLSNMTSEQRRKIFSQVDESKAKEMNALFEKGLVSNQKQAMKNWVWKNFYDGKPLYTNLDIKQSQAMRNAGLSVKDLKNMSAENRIKELSKYVSKDVADNLNKRFEVAQKSGNLSNWEERVIGTKKLWEDKNIKGALAKLEVIDDLGLLTPKETEKFMEDLVSSKLGVGISVEQAGDISRMTKKVSELWEKAEVDLTFKNEENIMNFFLEKKKLQDYIQKLSPSSVAEVFTNIGARGAILSSLRSITNSLMFQVVPGTSRAITKRIGSAMFIPGDYTMMQRMSSAMSSVSPRQLNFVWKQAKMGIKIYQKTGFDISRAITLDDGARFFGENFTHINGPSLKEAQGLKEKFGAIVRGHARIMEPGLKYAAGGTDTVFANLHRADTSVVLANTIAKAEQKTGKLKTTLGERITQLVNDSYSFNPKTIEGQYIREMGIMDAHMANFTNNDGWGELAIRFRNSLKIGDYKLGQVVIPFLKIPANGLGAGFEASGAGLITGSQKIIRGLRMESGASKNAAIAEGVNRMIVAGGLFGATTLFTSFLGVEDYVGPYDYRKRSENNLTLSKNAGSAYIRIGGKWYSTRWLGPMALPVNAMMMARQQKAEGKSALGGYMQGMFWGAMQFPGFKELGEMYEKVVNSSQEEDLYGIIKAMKLDPENIYKWTSVRTLPSFFTYDIMGLTNETKYDFLGRPVPKRGDSVYSAIMGFFIGSNIKPDTSNEITREADRLLLKGYLPVLTEPTGKSVDEAIEKYGEEGYLNRLNKFKQDYAKELERMINSNWYKKLSPEDKKKEWDNLRKTEILNRL